MQTEKQLLIEDFSKKSFTEQKNTLLVMLSKLYGTTDIVTKLGDMVYKLEDETRSDIYIEVYDILLDAVYAVQADELNESVSKLEDAKKVLMDMQKKEVEERNNINVDDILNQL